MKTSALSPPLVRRPYFVCAGVIAVSGVLPGATVELELEINGVQHSVSQTVADGGSVEIKLPKPFETTGDWIRARQHIGQDVSDWDPGSASPDNHALDVDETFPNGLPTPTVYWEPFFDCGVRVGVTNFVPGSGVWATVHPQAASEYRLFGASEVAWHAVEGEGPAFHATDELQGHYDFCGKEAHSAPMHRYEVAPLPPMPNGPPLPEIAEIFVDDRSIVVRNLMHGARVRVYDDTSQEVASGATASDSASFHSYRRLVAGEKLYAIQSFDDCDVQSEPGPTSTVSPCSALRAPVIHRPAPGEQELVVVHSQPHAVILVYDQSAQLIGRGIAPRVPLSRPLTTTEELRILQVLESCRSSTAYRIHVDCGPKGRGELDLLNLVSERKRRRGTTPLAADQCK